MKADEFDNLVGITYVKCKDILSGKALNYASETDRLANFKSAALFQDCEPEQALLGMMSKHLVALKDYVNGLPETMTSPEEWKEKIHDSINYLLLLKALIHERINSNDIRTGSSKDD